MLDKTTKKKGTIIDGVLFTKFEEDENIFIGCKKVDRLKAELEAAETAHTNMLKENVLEAFRDLVAEYIGAEGEKPSVALLGYYDRVYLLDAYNAWFKDKNGYSPTTYATVDGVKIRGGCNQTAGQVRFHQYDEGEADE
jgi:hypothetical protein